MQRPLLGRLVGWNPWQVRDFELGRVELTTERVRAIEDALASFAQLLHEDFKDDGL